MSTYRVRLLAYREDTEYDVTFGTCDICMHTGDAENPVYTFEFTDTETGEKDVRDVNGYEWDWGDYNTVDIYNVITFGDWLEDNTVTVTTKDMDLSDLRDLASRFYYRRRELDRQHTD